MDEEQKVQEQEQPVEKTISKKLFDEKVSELSRKNKELETQLKAKMSEDERKAAEKDEQDAEMQNIKNELAALKTESAFTTAGIKSETAKNLSEAIVGGDVSAIVEAVKAAIADTEKDTTAKVKQELLAGGSPKVQTGGKKDESKDPNMERIKNLAKPAKAKPLSESKYY